MSKAFLKNKQKRQRTCSNETNTSFVKHVTSKVSGLLPASITKWFSSPSSSNANGSTPTAEATDSSTEDEAPEIAPPAKRMRFSPPNKFNYFRPTDGNCTSSNIEITEIPSSHFPGTQFSNNRLNLTLTPIRSPNEPLNNETTKDKGEREMPRFKTTQHTVAKIGQSIAAKRRSIFDRSSNEEATKAKTKPSEVKKKKPCINPTLFGSPFYPGRTMYGGASSSSYINQPNIQQHTVAMVNETKSNEDIAMSSSARRIMDMLEVFSSPLTEARRIPPYIRNKTSLYHASANRSTASENKSLSAYKTQELTVPSFASILRMKQRSRLTDTTKAARQIIASHSNTSDCPLPYPTSKVTGTADTSHMNQESQPKFGTETEQSNKMTTKVKTRVTRISRGIPDQLDLITPLKLPSATLQIDQNNLPKFSLNTPPATKMLATSTPKAVLPAPKPTETEINTEVSTIQPEIVAGSNIFKFSNPGRLVRDTSESDTTPPEFLFDSPERRGEENCDSEGDDSSVVNKVKEIVKETDKSTTTAKDWSCPDCWVSNKPDVAKCVCCGYMKLKPAKCSVCKLADSQVQKDKCVNCDKAASPPQAKASQPSKWKCNSCWVMNEDSAEKCICCAGSKPTESTKSEKAPQPKVKNVHNCGGGFYVGSPVPNQDLKQFKPLPLSSTTTNFFGSNDKSDGTLLSLAKSQKSDSWECRICLVNNGNDRTGCICCGADKDLPKQGSGTKFNFFQNTNHSFKFGIDPQVQEATLAKKTDSRLSPTPKLKEQSEANNNVLAETPTFTFALSAKKPDTKIVSVIEKPESMKFNFGIKPHGSQTVNKSENTKIAEEDTEKLQEVPQVNYAAALEEKQKLSGLFTSIKAPQVEKDKPITMVSNLFGSTTKTNVTENPTSSKPSNANPSQLLLQPSLSSVEKSPLQSTFDLGPSTSKPVTNLFSTPSTVESSKNLFTPPSQSSVGTSNASTMPLVTLPLASVQKSDSLSVVSGPAVLTPAVPASIGIAPVSSAPVGIAPAAPAPVPPAAAPAPAPIFNFGSNGLNNITPMPSVSAAAPDARNKLQFPFMFGSMNPVKTDPAPSLLPNSSNTQSLFTTQFPTASENNVTNTSTFSLNSGNTLGSNNALTSNTLGATNGMSVSNGLVGNALSGNPVGNNTMSGSSLSGNLLGNNSLANNTFGGPNSLTSGNGVLPTSTLGGTNGLPGNAHTGGNNLQVNNTLTNNSLTGNPANIFGTPVQKENIWNSNANNNTASNNMFVSNSTTNNLQKPPAFAFGPSASFNSTSSATPFGQSAQPPQNIFASQSPIFSNSGQNQNPTPMFGSSQPNNNSMGMFGMNSNSPFGAQSSSIHSFEASSMTQNPASTMTQTPAPTFNFGAHSQSQSVFGFGQQQPQQQQEQQPGGVFGCNFGGGPGQVQFNMGATSGPAQPRRIRKVARRTRT